jgi:TPR repeat protein
MPRSLHTFVLVLVSVLALTAQAQSLERETPPCTVELQEHARAGAEQGDAASVYLLARYLSTGRCMPGDGRKAIRLYTQAAELNYPPAFYNLGMLAAARQDFASAEGYLARGASAGHRGCELQLGILYSLVPPPVGNDSKAFAWLSLTSSRPEPVAAEAADRLKVVRTRLSESNRPSAEALADRLKAQYLSLAPFTP